jgi:hypothetical protein
MSHARLHGNIKKFKAKKAKHFQGEQHKVLKASREGKRIGNNHLVKGMTWEIDE